MPSDGMCGRCSEVASAWRCLDCLGRPVHCGACCRTMHDRKVFHRVEHWTGSYWEPAWLRHVGVGIRFGHGGSGCPSIPPERGDVHLASLHNLPESNHISLEDEDDISSGAEPDDEPLRSGFSMQEFPKAGSLDSNGDPIMVIVDRSGVHHLGVKFCECPTALSKDLQLLEMRLYPGSFELRERHSRSKIWTISLWTTWSAKRQLQTTIQNCVGLLGMCSQIWFL
jgi:CxC2 like cysteine cluster associated with KDZ transposases